MALREYHAFTSPTVSLASPWILCKKAPCFPVPRAAHCCSYTAFICISAWANFEQAAESKPRTIIWSWHKMKYLQASHQEKIWHIYILPECRLCEHLGGRNPADAEKTWDCISVWVPFLPGDADGSIWFCLLQSAAVWVFHRRVGLISDSFGFGFCLFIYVFCDGCSNVEWWL